MRPETTPELPLHDLDTDGAVDGTGGHPGDFSPGPDDRGDDGRAWWIGMTPMTHKCGPIANLRSHLEMRCERGEDAGTLRRLADGGLDLAGATTVDELAAACLVTKDPGRSEQIVAALVALAPEDEIAALGALVALTPALIRLSRRMIAAGIDVDQADTDVIGTAFERILEISGSRRHHVARAVIGSSWDRLRWSLTSEQRCAIRRCPLDAGGDPMPDGIPVTYQPGITWILTDAVSNGAISAEAARIIHATRVEGRSFRSLSCELHKGEAALRKARQRSERALIDLHRSGSPDRSGDAAASQPDQRVGR